MHSARLAACLVLLVCGFARSAGAVRFVDHPTSISVMEGDTFYFEDDDQLFIIWTDSPSGALTPLNWSITVDEGWFSKASDALLYQDVQGTYDTAGWLVQSVNNQWLSSLYYVATEPAPATAHLVIAATNDSDPTESIGSTTTINITPRYAGLHVTITPPTTPIIPGTVLPEMFVVFTNDGPEDVTNLQLSWSPSSAWRRASQPLGYGFDVDYEGDVLEGTGGGVLVERIADGSGGRITFDMDVPPTATGTFVVTASASGLFTQTGPSGWESASYSVAYHRVSNASIAISGDDVPVDQQGAIEITATGGGPSAAVVYVDVAWSQPVDIVDASGTDFICPPATSVTTVRCTSTAPYVSAKTFDLRFVSHTAGALTATATISTDANDGTTGPKSDAVTVEVTTANQAPVISAPVTLAVETGAELGFTGAAAISISDLDAGTAELSFTLAVTAGTLTLESTADLALSTGTGTDDTTVAGTGTLAAINAALAGATFTADAAGDVTLTIDVDDQGNTGTGGPRTASAEVLIVVSDEPPPVDPGPTDPGPVDPDPTDPGDPSDPGADPANAPENEGCNAPGQVLWLVVALTAAKRRK